MINGRRKDRCVNNDGDKDVSYEQLNKLYNETYPEEKPISKFLLYRVVKRFARTRLITVKLRSIKPR